MYLNPTYFHIWLAIIADGREAGVFDAQIPFKLRDTLLERHFRARI